MESVPILPFEMTSVQLEPVTPMLHTVTRPPVQPRTVTTWSCLAGECTGAGNNPPLEAFSSPEIPVSAKESHVCCRIKSRKHLLIMRFSQFDPSRTLGLIRKLVPVCGPFLTRGPVAKC
jgi:hypothetical protein